MYPLATMALLSMFWLAGCQVSALLRTQHSEMKRLAYSDLRPAEQFDGLAELIVDVLQSALDQPTPNKSLRYLQKFSQQNRQELELITDQLQTWMKDQPAPVRALFLTRALTQPYARDLVDLVPRTQQLIRERQGTVGSLQKALLLFRLREMIKQ